MIDAFFKGEGGKAREINTGLLESWAFQGSDVAPNPIPAKAVMRVLGPGRGRVPAPDGTGPGRASRTRPAGSWPACGPRLRSTAPRQR